MLTSAIAIIGGAALIAIGCIMHQDADHSTALGRLNGPNTVEAGIVFIIAGLLLA